MEPYRPTALLLKSTDEHMDRAFWRLSLVSWRKRLFHLRKALLLTFCGQENQEWCGEKEFESRTAWSRTRFQGLLNL